jgi:TPP-dependent pyruvate/acetoin dehydrogenase alpha subunit
MAETASNNNILSDAVTGVTALVTGEDVTSSQHRASTALISAGVAIASMMWTRNRADQGKDAIYGFIG